MRLKFLTNLNTGLLLTVCVALATTLWWSQRALEKPYLLMSDYLSLSQQFQNEVAQNITQYLRSGDALLHNNAMSALDNMDQALQTLPATLSQTLQASLNELRAFASTDLLAAGKLAADPQGLLLQAERETDASLRQLAQYANQPHSTDANRYHAPLLNAASHLLRLAHARERLVSSGRAELATEVERELSALNRQLQHLNDLPLLGVYSQTTETAASFADLLGLDSQTTENQAEDQGITLKRELTTLIKRYPGELERTRQLTEQRNELTQASLSHIGQVQQHLAELEPQVRAEHSRIQGEVRLILGLVITMILLIALLIDNLQRRLARILTGLAPALSAWARGNFSQTINFNSNTQELQAIEMSLNSLRAYLMELVGTIRHHAEDVLTSSQTLAKLSSDLHSSAGQQNHDTALIHDSLGSLQNSVSQVAEDTAQVSSASQHANRALEKGQRVISQSLTSLHDLVSQVQGNAQSIEQLAEETASIDQVLTVIRGIAEQTNLLALNAAIEAARAGPQGRGFAVVADEVRSLSLRTRDAIAEIQKQIERLHHAAGQSLSAMQAQAEQAEITACQAKIADGALDEIVAAIHTISSMTRRIADATAQQNLTAGAIREHSERINQSSQGSLERISTGRDLSAHLLQAGGQLHKAVQSVHS